MKSVILDCLDIDYKTMDEIFETFDQKISDLEVQYGVKYKRYSDSLDWASSRGMLVHIALDNLIKDNLIESLFYGEVWALGLRKGKYRLKKGGIKTPKYDYNSGVPDGLQLA
jgi:hypothetical protein